MPNTYTFIAKATPSTGSFTFSSIPSTYTDLVILINARSTSTAVLQSLEARFNGTIAAVSTTFLQATGTTTSSGRSTSGNTIYFGNYPGSNAYAATFSNIEVYIPNYNSSDKKIASVTGILENNLVTSNNSMIIWQANLSAVTAPITSIFITDSGSVNFASGTEFYLYGIKNS